MIDKKALPKELRPIVPKFKGLGKRGFDVISSQFSIHYYFSDELTLRTYMQKIYLKILRKVDILLEHVMTE